MKRFFVGLILLVPFCSFAQNGFTIDATINGLAAGTNVTLVNINNSTEVLTKAVATAGKVHLDGKLPEPNLYAVVFDNKKAITIFMGNEKVVVKGNYERVDTAKVTGSVYNKDFIAFQQTLGPSFNKFKELNMQAGNPYLNKDSLKRIADNEGLLLDNKLSRFIETRKASPVATFALLVALDKLPNIKAVSTKFESLNPLAKQSFYGKILKERIDEASLNAIGTPAANFEQANTEGKNVSLADFKGKYVLIDFWASWCRPCRMENPNVVAAYNTYKNKNFTVLGVSMDNAKENWLKAIQDDNLTWTHVSDLQGWGNQVGKTYKITSIPQNILIDPQGIIVAKNLRGEELLAKLQELLAK